MPIPKLSPALFVALLARAGVSQAAFARLTPRQVNNWAAVLAVGLQEHSPEALTIGVEDTRATWGETPDGP